MAKECGKSENTSTTDMVELLTRKLPSSKTGKCFLACIGQTIGSVRYIFTIDPIFYNSFLFLKMTTFLPIQKIKDNKVDIEINVELARKAFNGDTVKIQQALQLANDCAKVTNKDRCEAAFQIFQCAMNAGKARGLTFDDI